MNCKLYFQTRRDFIKLKPEGQIKGCKSLRRKHTQRRGLVLRSDCNQYVNDFMVHSSAYSVYKVVCCINCSHMFQKQVSDTIPRLQLVSVHTVPQFKDLEKNLIGQS